jgi:hypothetical protein
MSTPKERYQHIDQLVLRHQQGDEEATLELIEIFNPLFKKYTRIIKEGKLDLRDYETRSFICLFIADPEIRRKLKLSKIGRNTRDAAYSALAVINTGFGSYAEEDLHHEQIVLLLKLAAKPIKKSFCAFVRGSYKFELSQLVKKVIRNPLNKAYPYMEPEQERSEEVIESILTDDEYPNLEPLNFLLPVDEYGELDINWCYGLGCGEVFESLTPFERQILKMHYIDRLGDAEISDQVGFHRNWVGIRRRNAVEKVFHQALKAGLIHEQAD